MFQLRALMAVACLSAAAQGGVISAPAPFALAAHAAPAPALALAAAPAPAKVLLAEPFDPNPQYSFSYGVSDPHTGDQKQQHETRSGDVVQGSYSLLEPDGTRRTVHYQADSHSGFNAVVHREPAVAKAIVAAPAPALSLSLGGYH